MSKINLPTSESTASNQPNADKLKKYGFPAALFATLATISTMFAGSGSAFAENNLSGLNPQDPKAQKILNVSDGEIVAEYINNNFSRQFKDSIYNLRDTVSSCRELHERIISVNKGDGLIEKQCKNLEYAIQNLEYQSKNVVNNSSQYSKI